MANFIYGWAWDTTLRVSHIYVHANPANRSVVFTALKDKQTYNIAVNPYTGQVIRAILKTFMQQLTGG